MEPSSTGPVQYEAGFLPLRLMQCCDNDTVDSVLEQADEQRGLLLEVQMRGVEKSLLVGAEVTWSNLDETDAVILFETLSLKP